MHRGKALQARRLSLGGSAPVLVWYSRLNDPQLGPFIDDRHPLIKAGDVDDLPAGIFASHISSRLGNLLIESPSTNVILIPSTRDLISKNAVFPQGPYDRDAALELPKVRRVPLSSFVPMTWRTARQIAA